LRKLFLGEHIAVAGFTQAKRPAPNRKYDCGLLPSAPPCRTGPRENSCDVNGGLFGQTKFAHPEDELKTREPVCLPNP
jgi:hypothetical protein